MMAPIPNKGNSRTEARLAEELLRAELDATPIEPPSARVPALTIRDAYAIQRRGRLLRVERGERLVGHKVGLTSEAMQEMLGVDQPDFGCIYESMVVPSGGKVDASSLIMPRVEGELAFRLNSDLPGPGVTRNDVLAATRAVLPALEVIDSRIRDWRITIVDTIADNASSAHVVLGDERSLASTALNDVEMTLTTGRESVSGAGAAVLGHPAEPVAWLANTLAEHGEHLERDEIVMPGALARALPVVEGAEVRAAFGSLGEVSVGFERAR